MNDMYRRLVIETVTLPHIAARRLLGLDLSIGVSLMVVVMAAAVSAVIFGLIDLAAPAPDVDGGGQVMGLSPLAGFVANILLMGVLTLLVVGVGRIFGGQGDFVNGTRLMACLFAVSTFAQMGISILMLALPFLGLMALFAYMVWYFWALTAFVAELHGFKSRMKVLGGILATSFVIGMLAAILLASFGITVQGPT